MKTSFLFAAWPYMALSLLLVGLGVRYLFERRQMAAVKEEMSAAWAVWTRRLKGTRWRIGGSARSVLAP